MPIRIKKHIAESWIRECDESQAFVCSDGQSAKSVKEMVSVLENMTPETYKFHANFDRNDFSAWAEGVFQNTHLAANFRKARSLREAFLYCQRHQLMLERNLRDARIKEEKIAISHSQSF
jgi:hypothetical protein